MQQPEKVFAEIYRVLKPGGVCVMAFSNRMFASKAVQVGVDRA
jgi:ubiquinone/menaquinone biosynthesis C-methylase UbiE